MRPAGRGPPGAGAVLGECGCPLRYGPDIATSISSPSLAATAEPRGTVRAPPPAGTVAVPVPFAVALSTATDSVPPAHPAAMPLTVTLTTFAPDRFWITPTPSESHCATVARF